MSHEQFPNSDSQQKGRHAGDLPKDLGRERPVREFRETPLEEASKFLEAPDTIDQGFQHHPLSPEEQKALDKIRKKQAKKEQLPAKRKRTFKIIAASALTSIAAAVGTSVATSSGTNDNPEIGPEPSVSAPVVPGEEVASPETVPLTLNPDGYYMEYDADPANMANSFSNFLTNTVNARYLSGTSNIEDLSNVVDDLNSPIAESLDLYIDGLVDNLERAKEEVDKKGLPYNDVTSGIGSRIISTEQNGNSSSAIVEFDYRVLSDRFEYLGPLRANVDRTELVFGNPIETESEDGETVTITTIQGMQYTD